MIDTSHQKRTLWPTLQWLFGSEDLLDLNVAFRQSSNVENATAIFVSTLPLSGVGYSAGIQDTRLDGMPRHRSGI
jgi:hypothetical protein